MRNSVAEFEGAVVVCRADVELDLPEDARRVDLPLQSLRHRSWCSQPLAGRLDITMCDSLFIRL